MKDFFPDSSDTASLFARTRITGDLDIVATLRYLDVFELKSIFHEFHTDASHGARRFTTTNNFWRYEECDLVDETSIDESSCYSRAALHQETLNRASTKFIEKF